MSPVVLHQIQILCRSSRAMTMMTTGGVPAAATAAPCQHYWKRLQLDHRHRALSSTTTPLATSPPLYAQPDRYVMGVTREQLASNQAMREWYAANCPDWENEPDQLIIGENSMETINKTSKDDDDEEDATTISDIVLPEHLAKRNIRPLVAYLRDPSGRESGSRNSRKLRLPSSVNDPNYFPLIPGILHGSDPTQNILSTNPASKIIVKTPWFEIQRELDRFHYGNNGSFPNRVYALTVFPSDQAHLHHHRKTSRNRKDSTPPRTAAPELRNVLVLPTDLQMHPVGHAAYCLNYVRYHPGKPIQIPIRVTNEEDSPAMKRGGFLSMVHRFVEVLVDNEVPVPERILLDASGLRQKDVVRRDRLILPRGVRVHPRVPEDYLIGTVFGAKGGGGIEDMTTTTTTTTTTSAKSGKEGEEKKKK